MFGEVVAKREVGVARLADVVTIALGSVERLNELLLPATHESPELLLCRRYSLDLLHPLYLDFLL
jgi:hypothetical protein